VQRDELAARLWVFLEAETLKQKWRYSLFSAPEGEPDRERDTPAIADVLRMRGWKRRRDIAARIKRAAAVIGAVDPTYDLTVEHSREASMWNLVVTPRPRQIEASTIPAPCQNHAQHDLDPEGGTPSRAGGVLPVAQGGTPSRAAGTLTVSSTVLKSYRQSDLKNMTRTTQDREQEQEMCLGERPEPCTLDDFTARLDPVGALAAIVGDVLVAELALAVCRQYRAASGGVLCGDIGDQFDCDGEPLPCLVGRAMRGVGIKSLNYITNTSHPVRNPAGYIVRSIERAIPDTANLMEKTKADSEERLKEMRALAPHNPAPVANAETVAELVSRAAKDIETAPIVRVPDTSADDAERAREARARYARAKSMTSAEIAVEFEKSRQP
jgi:hypothetical protein